MPRQLSARQLGMVRRMSLQACRLGSPSDGYDSTAVRNRWPSCTTRWVIWPRQDQLCPGGDGADRPRQHSKSEDACCQQVQCQPTGRPIRARRDEGKHSTNCPKAGFRAIPVRSKSQVGSTMHRCLPILIVPNRLKTLKILLAPFAGGIVLASTPTDRPKRAQGLVG